jgi:hypothetical protein
MNLFQAPPTFTPRWKYKLPSQFKAGDLGAFLMEYYNQSCAESFLLDPKFERCISNNLFNKLSGIELYMD